MQVLIVDDQAAFRAAARAVVERCAGFHLAAEAETGAEAVEMVRALAPDLVLMDINLGDSDGIELTRRIVGIRPATRVVLVSTYDVDQLPATVRTSGAVAYLNKDELSQRTLRRLWDEGEGSTR